MIKILQRRFLGEGLIYFFVTFCMFNFIFLMGNLLQLLHKGIDFSHALPILPYILPYSFPFTIPMGLLAATSLVVGRMVVDGELLIVKASGIHLSCLVVPLLLVALLLSIFSYYFQADVIPYCFEQMKLGIRNSLYAHFMTGEGKNRSFDVGKTKIYCDRYQRGKFKSLMVLTYQGNKWLKISAQHGQAGLVGKEKKVVLTLFDVSILEVNSPTHHLWAREITMPMELNLGRWDREEFQTTSELRKRERKFRLLLRKKNLSPQQKQSYQKEYRETVNAIYNRYSMALSCFSLTLLAMAFSFLLPYKHRVSPLFLSLLGASCLYFAPFFGGRILVEKALVIPPVGFFIPHLISFVVGSLLLWKAFRS